MFPRPEPGATATPLVTPADLERDNLPFPGFTDEGLHLFRAITISRIEQARRLESLRFLIEAMQGIPVVVQIRFGMDQNRNGMVDPHESGMTGAGPMTPTECQLRPG